MRMEPRLDGNSVHPRAIMVFQNSMIRISSFRRRTGTKDMNEQQCPICRSLVKANPRYPRYLCGSCASMATAPDNRLLSFGNTGIAGGYVAIYRDTGECYSSHVCFVKGIVCWVDEARFGGIVIEAIDPESLQRLINRCGRPVPNSK